MTSSVANQDKVSVNCFHCNASLQILSQKVEKKTKCPKCQTVFIPSKHIEEMKKVIEKANIGDKKSRVIPILLILICTALIFSWFIARKNKVKLDETLLTPSIQQDSKAKNFQNLDENEFKEILASYKNPSLIPKGFEIPESTIEQDRPTRSFLAVCKEGADKLIEAKKTKPQVLFNQENVILFNNAFAKTNDPKYLSFIINEFNNAENHSFDSVIAFSEILKTQREAVSYLNSNDYVNSIDKIKLKIKEQLNTKDPIQSVNLLLLANSLPLEAYKLEVLQKVKPVLELAYKNSNETRKDGLLLSPEESTTFSLKLIKLAWSYHLDKKRMPEWLYNLAEKESCRLAYRLEQDGCLPVWEKGEKRYNYTEDIYKASVVFDRDDLRYIGYSGWRLGNSYSPIQKNFDFSELGVLIIRSDWNHSHSVIPPLRGFRLPAPDSMQITYNKSLNMISVSIGTLTQLLFKTTKVFYSVGDLEHNFQFSFQLVGKQYQYKLEIEDFELDLINLSMPYKITEKGEFKSDDMLNYTNTYRLLKDAYDIEWIKNENNKIKKITFYARQQK